MAFQLHEFNVRLIMYIHDYENKENIQVQLKIPSPSFKVMLDHAALSEQSNRPNKIVNQKTLNPYES